MKVWNACNMAEDAVISPGGVRRYFSCVWAALGLVLLLCALTALGQLQPEERPGHAAFAAEFVPLPGQFGAFCPLHLDSEEARLLSALSFKTPRHVPRQDHLVPFHIGVAALTGDAPAPLLLPAPQGPAPLPHSASRPGLRGLVFFALPPPALA